MVLNSNTEKSGIVGIANEKKEKELIDRESKFKVLEIAHAEKEKEFMNEFNRSFKGKVLLLKTRKSAFLKAIESITWK